MNTASKPIHRARWWRSLLCLSVALFMMACGSAEKKSESTNNDSNTVASKDAVPKDGGRDKEPIKKAPYVKEAQVQGHGPAGFDSRHLAQLPKANALTGPVRCACLVVNDQSIRVREARALAKQLEQGTAAKAFALKTSSQSLACAELFQLARDQGANVLLVCLSQGGKHLYIVNSQSEALLAHSGPKRVMIEGQASVRKLHQHASKLWGSQGF